MKKSSDLDPNEEHAETLDGFSHHENEDDFQEDEGNKMIKKRNSQGPTDLN